MNAEQAETIALQALSFLAKDDDLLSQFLTTTGLEPQDLKKRFREPELLGAVLDTILGNDAILLRTCRHDLASRFKSNMEWAIMT